MRASGKGRVWRPYLLVMAGTAAGLCAIGLGMAPWVGGVVIGVSLLVGAALRFLGSGRGAGMLAVLGAALVAGSLSLLLSSLHHP